MLVARDRISVSMLACVGSRCWITTNAIPVSEGRARRISVKASSPPAEAPMPTMGNGATVGRGFGSSTKDSGAPGPECWRRFELLGVLGLRRGIDILLRWSRCKPRLGFCARRGRKASRHRYCPAPRSALVGALELHGEDDGRVSAIAVEAEPDELLEGLDVAPAGAGHHVLGKLGPRVGLAPADLLA